MSVVCIQAFWMCRNSENWVSETENAKEKWRRWRNGHEFHGSLSSSFQSLPFSQTLSSFLSRFSHSYPFSVPAFLRKQTKQKRFWVSSLNRVWHIHAKIQCFWVIIICLNLLEWMCSRCPSSVQVTVSFIQTLSQFMM